MDTIITKLMDILKGTENMISMEEQMHLFMYEVFCEALGEVFRYLDQAIVKEKQKLGWKVERKDWRTLQFTLKPEGLFRSAGNAQK